MACRTLLVDATQAQKQAYLICVQALDHTVNSIKMDQPIKNLFEAAKNFIGEKNPGLVSKLHSHVGFGIGFSCREKTTLIN